MEDLQKLVWLTNLEGHTVFCCFLGQYSSESWFLGVFRNLQDLLLLMGTEIFKIDAEMAEKIEVEVGNPHLESDRQSENWFLCSKCQLQLQFSQPFLHRFWKSLCPSTRGDPDDSKTPPEVIFLMSISQENSKKRSGTKTAFLNWIWLQFLKIFHFLQIAVTWLKIIRILQVGGVLESSGPPLDDGHRDF